jgi:hypothetical protein
VAIDDDGEGGRNVVKLNALKIGAVTYDVRFVGELTRRHDDGTWVGLHGVVDYVDCTIRIEAEQNVQVKRTTVLHEAVHAILHNAGLDDHDERLVVALGFGLDALLRENPALVEWLGLLPAPSVAAKSKRGK